MTTIGRPEHSPGLPTSPTGGVAVGHAPSLSASNRPPSDRLKALKIIYVPERDDVGEALQACLAARGITIAVCSSTTVALERVTSGECDFLITALKIFSGSGRFGDSTALVNGALEAMVPTLILSGPQGDAQALEFLNAGLFNREDLACSIKEGTATSLRVSLHYPS